MVYKPVELVNIGQTALYRIARGLRVLKYTPAPIDTGTVTLPHDILELIERLAENNHDIWAQERFRTGWIYGPVRNDERKEHPCLVPYQELPESEKDYDRLTASEALKAIMALGYRIEKRC